jgi:hypothetical protein
VKINLLLITFLSLVGFQQTGHSACTLSLSNISSPVNFTSNQAPGGLTFRVRKSATNQSCSFFVGFSKGSATTYSDRRMVNGSYTIPFNTRKTSVQTDPALSDYPDATSSTEVFVSSFANGNPTSKTFTYYPTTTAWSTSNNHRFGLHSDTLQIHVYESSFPPPASPTLTAEATANVNYTYTVAKAAIVSLLNVGVAYSDPAVTTKTLTYTNMEAGQSVSLDMVLIYNAGYSVKFNSTNGQKMKSGTFNFPYTYSITSVPAPPTLVAGVDTVVMSGSGVSPNAPAGDRRTVTFTLGTPNPGAFAGTYTDSILITLTSTE